MSSNVLRVADFSIFPGPRYEVLGPASGEEFRDTKLLPALREHGANLIIDLDGVISYGSSFLEESFGGAVRSGIDPAVLLKVIENIICNDEPTLKFEIESYVKEQTSQL